MTNLVSQDIEAPGHLRLRQAIQKAVQQGAVGRVIQLVLSQPDGLDVLAGGFGAGLTIKGRVSFAEYCLRLRQPQVLYGVVEGTPGRTPAEMLQAATTWLHFNRPRRAVISRTRSLYTLAFETQSVEALRAAIRMQPDFPGLTEAVAGFGGFYEATVHAGMLFTALMANDQVKAAAALRCCKVLLDMKAPVLHAQSQSPVTEWFVCALNGDSRGDDLVPLFKAYAAAGYVDPSTRFGPDRYTSRPSVSNKLPLLAAIEQGNDPIAKQLVLAGCDLEAVEADVRAAGHADLIAMIRAEGGHGVEEFVAEMTEALMRRRLAEHAMVSPAPTPASARGRRAGL